MHWHAWNDEALARAKRENKPILVSIGYSTCHWCHVMERESFEDEATAAVMNQHFVCIKVDREERPDVDQIYMEACQAINGSGGWPLNAFLLPDGRPFYAGTYYPPEAKYNRPSWKDVLSSLATSYREKHEEVLQQADRLTRNIAGSGMNMLQIEPDADDHLSWRTSLMQKLRDSFDHQHGGFGGAPKFPMSQSLEALLAGGVLHQEPMDVHLAETAVLAMLNGGIYDHLGGGFSRYTVDAAWRVPHFEKMLYDNALLLRLISKLQLVRPNPRYLEAIAETSSWLAREMALSGGYRAALDADSEGVEGKYFVWQQEEIEGILPKEQAEVFNEFYGITEGGNWAEEHTNIPYRPHPLPAAAAKLGITEERAKELLRSAKEKLHEVRFETRVHPGADDKIILQWNALMISAWTWCYRATGDASYRKLATDLWASLQDLLYKDGKWHRNFTNGQIGAPAFLDDLAALAEAGLDLYDATFNISYLLPDAPAGTTELPDKTTVKGLLDFILKAFPHDDSPMFHLRRNGDNELPISSVDLFDNALPSGNSQVMSSLLRMARITDEANYLRHGENMLAAMAGSLQRYPSSFGGWLHAALIHAAADRELVITGPGAKEEGQRLLSGYRPGLLVAASDTQQTDLNLFNNRYLPDGLRFYVCEHKACQVPVNTLEEALAQLSA